jgi:hypothetical protein
MGTVRRSTARFGVWVVLAAVMLAAVSVTAFALTRGNGNVPPKRPLAVALHDALASKPVAGVSARFTLTQNLIPGTSKALATSPILGASGSVWASGDQVELVIHSALGTAEASFDGHTITLYEPKQHTAYRLTLPDHGSSTEETTHHGTGIPSVTEINHAITELSKTFAISGAIPGTIAGQPEYTVNIQLRHDSGLFGPLQIAWDAAHGTPLRIALYSRGSSTPALAFTVSHISYGKQPASATRLTLPAGTKVANLHLPSKAEVHHAFGHPRKRAQQTLDHAAPAAVRLPATLAGMTRTVAHATGLGSVAVYGHGLGSIVVIARQAHRGEAPSGPASAMLPSAVTVNGARGHELVTTLGTIVGFTRGGVGYTVLGSQPAATILTAARALP